MALYSCAADVDTDGDERDDNGALCSRWPWLWLSSIFASCAARPVGLSKVIPSDVLLSQRQARQAR